MIDRVMRELESRFSSLELVRECTTTSMFILTVKR